MGNEEKQTKKNPQLSFNASKTTWAHLRRIQRTGLYGNKESDVAYILVQEGIKLLLESGRLTDLEKFTALTLEDDEKHKEEAEDDEPT